MKHGQGTYAYADGSKYEGKFKDNNCYGYGILHIANGTKYEGEFKDDKRHG